MKHCKYGNMDVICTSSGYNVRRFKTHYRVGMAGINVGVPAPMAVFPFACCKQSFFVEPAPPTRQRRRRGRVLY